MGSEGARAAGWALRFERCGVSAEILERVRGSWYLPPPMPTRPPIAPRPLRLLASTVALLVVLVGASTARADGLDPALSRLGTCTDDGSGGATCVRDDDAWRSFATEFAMGLAPSLAHAADGTGVRGFSLSFETRFTDISEGEDYWANGTEGDRDDEPNRFVPNTMRFGRLVLRKGLPYGLELGANVGHVFDSSLWTAGAELQWSLFEGFSRGPLGVLPDLAIRGAVNTLVGEGELYITVPSLDFIISKPFTVARRFDLVPLLSAQLLWIFADSEVTDLTPDVDAIGQCIPSTNTVTLGTQGLACESGDVADLHNSTLFPQLRSFRARIAGGLLIRYRVAEVGAVFSYDLVSPSSADEVLPAELPSQWSVTLTTGLRY